MIRIHELKKAQKNLIKLYISLADMVKKSEEKRNFFPQDERGIDLLYEQSISEKLPFNYRSHLEFLEAPDSIISTVFYDVICRNFPSENMTSAIYRALVPERYVGKDLPGIEEIVYRLVPDNAEDALVSKEKFLSMLEERNSQRLKTNERVGQISSVNQN